jgi:hypothetical protein
MSLLPWVHGTLNVPNKAFRLKAFRLKAGDPNTSA